MIKNKVSVIVPVYNSEKFLWRCLNSILTQSYNNIEVIIIDDGSVDGSFKIANEIAKTDKRVKIFKQVNRGPGAARNRGLDVASGDLVLFVDSDDFIRHDMILTMVTLLKKYNADMVQCDYLEGRLSEFNSYSEDKAKLRIYNNRNILYSKDQKVVLWAKLYKRELWKNIRMPAGNLNYEDDATTWKLYFSAKKIVYSTEKLYYYYNNDRGIMSTQRKKSSLKFIDVYNDRIKWFVNENDFLMTAVSKWKFCMCLAATYLYGNNDQKAEYKLIRNFRQNVIDALLCNRVPVSDKLKLMSFCVSPKLCQIIFKLKK